MGLFACIGVMFTILFHSAPVLALWCGDALIMEDQSALEVREIIEKAPCGELLASEAIGSVRKVVRREDPFYYPDYGFYGHRYHYHGGYAGLGPRPGIGRIIYHSEKIEEWRVRITNPRGVAYCYDLVFRSGVLRAIGIGDPCGRTQVPE